MLGNSAALGVENVTYSYDALGRLVIVSKANGGNLGSNATYQYDNAGNRANVATNASWTLNSTYAGDFNGDGKSDVLWRHDNGTITTWFADIYGGFTGTNVSLAVPVDWKVNVVGDFNGDGRSDLLLRSNSGDLTVRLGQTDGSFTDNSINAYSSGTNNWQIVGVGDFNGDGRSDILWRYVDGTVTDWLGTTSGGFFNNGGNYFSLIDPAWRVIATRDFNGDGRSDILFRTDKGDLTVFLGQTNGGFIDNSNASAAFVSPDWHIVGAGDFNGDARSDIIWRNDNGTISVWLTNSNGSYTGASSYAPVTSWHVVSIGDFNGDGKADLLWRADDGNVSWWFATSGGAFTSVNNYINPGLSWHVEARRLVPTNPVPPPAYFAIGDAPAVDEGANAIFTISRVGTYQSTQSVNYATSSGTATSGMDFTARSGTLTFGPTETQKTISVPITIDNTAEPAETLFMTLTSPTGGAVLGRATATGYINVSSAPNQPPVANPDSGSTEVCQSVTINLTANDTDPEGDLPLTVISVGNSNLGSVTIVSGTSIQFNAYGVPGNDQITYTVRDSRGAIAAGVVSIAVGGDYCQ